MRLIALGAGQRLGLSVVLLDVRIIVEAFASGYKNKKKEFVPVFPPSYQDLHSPGVCYTADGATIVNLYSPCLLCIENIDAMIFPDASADSSQPQSEENEIQEILAACLGLFFDNLWSAIADSAKSKNEICESRGERR